MDLLNAPEVKLFEEFSLPLLLVKSLRLDERKKIESHDTFPGENSH